MNKYDNPNIMVVLGIILIVLGIVLDYYKSECDKFIGGIMFGMGLGVFLSNAHRLVIKEDKN